MIFDLECGGRTPLWFLFFGVRTQEAALVENELLQTEMASRKNGERLAGERTT